VTERIARFFFTGRTGERLAATRLLLGIGFVALFVYDYGALFLIDPFGPAFRFIEPIWYFDLLGIRRGVPWLGMLGVLALSAALVGFAIGWRTRWCAVAALLLIPLLKGARDSVAGDVHHREFIPFHLLFFLACSRCGEVGSLDARRAGGDTRLAEWEASWPIQASQLYIATFYFWGGLAKLRGTGFAWFDVDVVRYQIFQRAVRFGVDANGAPPDDSIGYWVAAFPALLFLPSLGVAAMELCFPVVLVLRAFWTRAVFVAGVTAFHVGNFVLMNVHFLLMPVAFVVYFDVSGVAKRLAPRLFASS
jgi:hypothetical protein